MIRGCQKRARRGLLSRGQAAVGGCQTAERGGRSNPHSWTAATATVCSVAATLSPGTHLPSLQLPHQSPSSSACTGPEGPGVSRCELPPPERRRLPPACRGTIGLPRLPSARPLWRIQRGCWPCKRCISVWRHSGGVTRTLLQSLLCLRASPPSVDSLNQEYKAKQ